MGTCRANERYLDRIDVHRKHPCAIVRQQGSQRAAHDLRPIIDGFGKPRTAGMLHSTDLLMTVMVFP